MAVLGEGPSLVLFHGGAGSWRHWPHNIACCRDVSVLVPDLPGLGESAFPPNGDDADAVAAIVADGIDAIVGADARYDVAGFSFGGTMASLRRRVARRARAVGHDHRLQRRGTVGQRGEAVKVRHLKVRKRRDASDQPQPADDRGPGEDR